MARIMMFALVLLVMVQCQLTASEPSALHQLVVVDAAGDAVVRLHGYDVTTPSSKLSYTIQSSTSGGELRQLSQVYSDYGYEPKAGSVIKGMQAVTGSQNRVYYKRPATDRSSENKWDTFTFTAADPTGASSTTGTVTLVPPSGNLVGSAFLLNNEAWKVTGNKASAGSWAAHESLGRGAMMNYYVRGSDDKITLTSSGADTSLWYFQAPAAYLGNMGIAYGGSLSFTQASFSGDFSKMNPTSSALVELTCDDCIGPVHKGITLKFPISASTAASAYKGDVTRFTLPLVEERGWIKDPQNSLLAWTKASKCDIIQVLSRLSSMKILGDWTTWYETIGLDDVQISNTKSKLPVCAMSKNDASICTC
jgi:hypothetical protein